MKGGDTCAEDSMSFSSFFPSSIYPTLRILSAFSSLAEQLWEQLS